MDGYDVHSKNDIEKYIVYPGSLKAVIANIYENITPGTMMIQLTDQRGRTYGGIQDHLRSYISIFVNDGMLDESIRILSLHEAIMEISGIIYSQDTVQFELVNIFLLLYYARYDDLAKKLNSDYDIFKQQTLSSIKH